MHSTTTETYLKFIIRYNTHHPPLLTHTPIHTHPPTHHSPTHTHPPTTHPTHPSHPPPTHPHPPTHIHPHPLTTHPPALTQTPTDLLGYSSAVMTSKSFSTHCGSCWWWSSTVEKWGETSPGCLKCQSKVCVVVSGKGWKKLEKGAVCCTQKFQNPFHRLFHHSIPHSSPVITDTPSWHT